jgi:hypothetical protein
MMLTIRNTTDAELAPIRVEGQALRHDGPMPASQLDFTQVNSFSAGKIDRLPIGRERRLRIDLPRSLVPSEGHYAVRLQVSTERASTVGAFLDAMEPAQRDHWLLMVTRDDGPPLEVVDLLEPDQLAMVGRALADSKAHWSDPENPIRQHETLMDLQTKDFIVVEPLLNLLTFMLAIGTALMAIATVVLAIRS